MKKGNKEKKPKIVNNSNCDVQQAQGIAQSIQAVTATSTRYIPDTNTCSWNKALENKD